MTRLTLAAGALAACGAIPAQATPPDLIRITDELLAVSAERVFILRSSIDNLGSHSADIRSLALIGIDRATGAETVWPAYAVSRQSDDESGAVVRPLDQPGGAASFTILHESAALPVTPSGTDTPLVPWEDDGAGALRIHADCAGVRQAGLADLEIRTGRQLADFGRQMDYTRMGALSFAQMLAETDALTGQCQPGYAVQISAGDGGRDPVVMRLQCGEDDGATAVIASVLLLIPPDGAGGPGCEDQAEGARPQIAN
ncbi:MAG: hypothetical protein Q4G25_12355 [Paracoccus sp. (in: a-proteobacteria)]|nr:hypothetical protein [Paracoccus sp. (in: a-proteobacteria)]